MDQVTGEAQPEQAVGPLAAHARREAPARPFPRQVAEVGRLDVVGGSPVDASKSVK